MKTFKLGILALVLGLFTLTSCEKDELEVDAPPTSSSTGGSTTEPIDTVAFVDSMMTVWVTNGGAKLFSPAMGHINFLVSSSGELDSLTFENTWVNDFFVEGGSFEYLNDGRFVFKYDQLRETHWESFIDTVTMAPHPVAEGNILVGWKHFQWLTPENYEYTYVD